MNSGTDVMISEICNNGETLGRVITAEDHLPDTCSSFSFIATPKALYACEGALVGI